MEQLPNLYKSRKFFALLALICFLGLRHEVSVKNDFSFFIVILFMGFCSSFYSIYMLTKAKKE